MEKPWGVHGMRLPHLNADVLQCVVYDSPKENARLIGVEYIISEALFGQLPAEEKQLWPSHRYEVVSACSPPRVPPRPGSTRC